MTHSFPARRFSDPGRGRARPAADLFLGVIGEAAGKLEHRLGRDVFDDQLGRAFPANFDAREQIGLRAREPIEPRGLELEVWPENLDIRSEEHTSELQSLMRNSYAVFCLKTKK